MLIHTGVNVLGKGERSFEEDLAAFAIREFEDNATFWTSYA